MTPKDLFPAALISLNLGACITSMFATDYPKAVYWFAAALLNCTVAFPQIFKP